MKGEKTNKNEGKSPPHFTPKMWRAFLYDRRSNMFCLLGQEFGQMTEFSREAANTIEKSGKIGYD